MEGWLRSRREGPNGAGLEPLRGGTTRLSTSAPRPARWRDLGSTPSPPTPIPSAPSQQDFCGPIAHALLCLRPLSSRCSLRLPRKDKTQNPIPPPGLSVEPHLPILWPRSRPTPQSLAGWGRICSPFHHPQGFSVPVTAGSGGRRSASAETGACDPEVSEEGLTEEGTESGCISGHALRLR